MYTLNIPFVFDRLDWRQTITKKCMANECNMRRNHLKSFAYCDQCTSSQNYLFNEFSMKLFGAELKYLLRFYLPNNKSLNDLRQHSYGHTPWTHFEYFIYVDFGFHWIAMAGKINHNMAIKSMIPIVQIYVIDKLFMYLLNARRGERAGKKKKGRQNDDKNRNERSNRS